MEPVLIGLSELESYQHQGGGLVSGAYRRYFCPIHGSDRQRSLSLDPETGMFRCFACGAWGYVPELRRGRMAGAHLVRPTPAAHRSKPPHPALPRLLGSMRKELLVRGNWGVEYLLRRGIPLELALRHGAGYVSPLAWPNPRRRWKWGRLAFPHTTPDGSVVNLYGRAIGSDEKVPKDIRHDHLSGPKGVFNASALLEKTVYVCEGVFDALSVMAAGLGSACAVFGVNGLPLGWIRSEVVVFCFDQDEAGGRWRELAAELVLAGRDVLYAAPDVFGKCKDLNEVWQREGRLMV